MAHLCYCDYDQAILCHGMLKWDSKVYLRVWDSFQMIRIMCVFSGDVDTTCLRIWRGPGGRVTCHVVKPQASYARVLGQ